MSAVPDISLTRNESFAFVQSLAADLSGGKVVLAGFPDAAVRMQRVLADAEVTTERVVRVIGSEPALAAQLLQISNSIAPNPAGKPVADLHTAVTHVGLKIVHAATIAFAVRQLRGSAARQIQKPLEELWRRNVLIASLCYLLARRYPQVNADTALLTGMLQGIGRLYVMTRAAEYPALFANLASYHAVERDWHLSMAAALLESWKVADEIVQAVRNSEDMSGDPRAPLSLRNLLLAANLIVIHEGDPVLLGARLQSIKPLARMRLDARICEELVRSSEAQIVAKALS
jgi:HD-like signal output (HDOD) protein